MINTEPFQIIECRGTPYEIGFAHGEQAKEKIRLNIREYEDMFKISSDIDWAQARKRSLYFVDYIRQLEPDLLEEMRGVADGAGLELADILALNSRSEIVFGLAKDGCTSFTITPEASANGHTLIGQNWDWRVPIADGLIILKIYQQGKPGIFMVTEAGIIGKVGMNSEGLGVCLNALVVQGQPEGLPLHIILRRILNSKLLNDALLAINGVKNAGPANYMFAQKGGCALDVEKTPQAWDYTFNDRGILVHSNHILSPRLLARVNDQGTIRFLSSIVRYHMMTKMLNREIGDITVEYLMECLRSHHQGRESICCHADSDQPLRRQSMTCFSMIMDLDTNEMWLTPGPPCQFEYTRYLIEF
ncbi:MAG TPA: acyl-CoA--6-aminopenicillanic acid acyl-transferase [Clostridiaceae bacterium]|nr:acyl-CoA--6-aminopenicillanic acid acyl-transferase [Clostridiaceae bacterium]